jgi:threonyl-tRNA synthetase
MPTKKTPPEDSLSNIRHSLAHVLAAAVLKRYPKTKLGIGPVIENGFYYDFQFKEPISADSLKELEKDMRRIINGHLPFTGKPVTALTAKKLFKGQTFKLDLIKDLVKEKQKMTAYKTGEIFLDLCRGGHVKNTKEINPESFKLTHVAGAYWKGDEKKAQLTRIYGLAFATKKELEDHLVMIEEAKKRDHKKIGPELDLFVFSDLVGPGLPLWTPKGTLVRNLLDEFVWELREEVGYMKVEIPHITKKDLYEKSGHWDKFKEELFRIKTREGHEFAMKPMNCPHHTQIYARRQWSYRDLPQRYANSTMCYRDEQTGELAGLSRVRAFTQDDAHVFCRMSQAKEEFLKIWDIVEKFYKSFNFELKVRLSVHDPAQPEKYLGDKKRWQMAEKILKDIVKEKKIDWFEGVGEAAFYGPKLDFMTKDAIGREWQIATIQLDMNMPENFDLTCINEKGKPERIVMIHAAIMGSIERFLSILIEHTAGQLPTWLSPVQVQILPISEKFALYGVEIMDALRDIGIRAELTAENESLGRRIRGGELQKIPYLLIVGQKEQEEKTVSVRSRDKGQVGTKPLEDFIDDLLQEVEAIYEE